MRGNLGRSPGGSPADQGRRGEDRRTRTGRGRLPFPPKGRQRCRTEHRQPKITKVNLIKRNVIVTRKLPQIRFAMPRKKFLISWQKRYFSCRKIFFPRKRIFFPWKKIFFSEKNVLVAREKNVEKMLRQEKKMFCYYVEKNFFGIRNHSCGSGGVACINTGSVDFSFGVYQSVSSPCTLADGPSTRSDHIDLTVNLFNFIVDYINFIVDMPILPLNIPVLLLTM